MGRAPRKPARERHRTFGGVPAQQALNQSRPPRRCLHRPVLFDYSKSGDMLRVYATMTLTKAEDQMQKNAIISRDPEVLNGELVFAKTRVPVETLIHYLAAGDTLDEFLDAFPTVTREQAIAYLEWTLEAVDARAA